MTENFNRTFIDTAPFVYLLEYNEVLTDKTKQIFCGLNANTKFTTSVITYAEYCVKPKKINNQKAITKFKNLLNDLECDIESIDIDIADITAELRAKYQFLRTPDALQLATAIYNNCNKFITNDKKLKQITEIEVVLIAD